LLLYEKALIEKDRPQINFARMKEAEAEELLKQLAMKIRQYLRRFQNIWVEILILKI